MMTSAGRALLVAGRGWLLVGSASLVGARGPQTTGPAASTSARPPAITDPSTPTSEEAYTVPLALTQDERVNDDLPFGSQGGVAFRHQFLASVDYSIRVTLRRQSPTCCALSAPLIELVGRLISPGPPASGALG